MSCGCACLQVGLGLVQVVPEVVSGLDLTLKLCSLSCVLFLLCQARGVKAEQ